MWFKRQLDNLHKWCVKHHLCIDHSEDTDSSVCKEQSSSYGLLEQTIERSERMITTMTLLNHHMVSKYLDLLHHRIDSEIEISIDEHRSLNESIKLLKYYYTIKLENLNLIHTANGLKDNK